MTSSLQITHIKSVSCKELYYETSAITNFICDYNLLHIDYQIWNIVLEQNIKYLMDIRVFDVTTVFGVKTTVYNWDLLHFKLFQ